MILRERALRSMLTSGPPFISKSSVFRLVGELRCPLEAVSPRTGAKDFRSQYPLTPEASVCFGLGSNWPQLRPYTPAQHLFNYQREKGKREEKRKG
ncbi:hypothetical protein MANES_01G250650v8 [Manihot esculenta]|uniref:Uncharacterized protein n=1 Tax=Manihot esculenta TaxID=3983 RepID=A0ACB7IF87_MANES|nr:hypothetical protein MANES_01G250650v8 [Manihot esculenta]